MDEIFKKIPNLKVKFKLYKERENLDKVLYSMDLEIKKLSQEIIKNIEKNGKKKQLNEELPKLSNAILSFKSSLDSIKNSFIEIGSKDLFDYDILKSDIMFEIGKTMKTGYESALASIEEVNFGGISQLERKKSQEQVNNIINTVLSKPQEEKKG